jgi:hypothetical protein
LVRSPYPCRRGSLPLGVALALGLAEILMCSSGSRRSGISMDRGLWKTGRGRASGLILLIVAAVLISALAVWSSVRAATVSPAFSPPDLPQLDCDRFVQGEVIHKTPPERIFALDVSFDGDYPLLRPAR